MFWSFSTANSITVTSLGWWDYQNDGLTESHQVVIWDMSGTQLISGTVAAGMIDPLISDFRFNSSLTGKTTLAPEAYVIGGLSTMHDPVTGILSPGNNGTVGHSPGYYLHSYPNERIAQYKRSGFFLSGL